LLKKRLLGIIDATTYKDELGELIVDRSLAAVPFAGRYRFIDFILSSMVNSGINKVAVFPKYQYRSLMNHLGTGKNWDLDRKCDGIFLFPPLFLDRPNDGVGSFYEFAANLDFFYRSMQEYTLIANCFTVANFDFREILQAHINSECDITEIRHEGKSLEMYLIKTSLLIELIENREKTGFTCMRDVVQSLQHDYKLCYYQYNGYAAMIDSIKKYYTTSMELLNPGIWKKLFLEDRPIFTKVMDEPPTRYSQGASIHNSMIANGCQIEGKVENSIIARGVKIGKNTVVRNSVILQKCEIAAGCELDGVILDKDVVIEPNSVLKASHASPIVIRKGTVQGALMNS
jgi:glucose-1-phosphate adenylyltransferase